MRWYGRQEEGKPVICPRLGGFLENKSKLRWKEYSRATSTNTNRFKRLKRKFIRTFSGCPHAKRSCRWPWSVDRIYREVLSLVGRFTATGVPPAARRIRILQMNQYAFWPITFGITIHRWRGVENAAPLHVNIFRN
jgi:hypothetical protein